MAKRHKRNKKRSFLPTLLAIFAGAAVLVAAMMAYGMLAAPQDATQSLPAEITAEPTIEITAEPTATPVPPTAVPMSTVEPFYTIAPTPEPERVNNELPYLIVVNYKAQLVRVYTLDENGNYTVLVKNMLTSSGKTNIAPTGIFKLHDPQRWIKFLDGTYGQYSTRITGHYLFHSIPYKGSYDNDTLIAKYYNQLGDNVSGGCMRLMCKDAKWIYDNCPKGTIVIITKGEEVDPSVYDTIVQPELISGKWDPTDPDPNNPDYFDESDATPPPTCYPYATPNPDQYENTIWK